MAAKPTPKPTPKPTAKPKFSDSEIKKFRTLKTGADVLSLSSAQQKKFMDWQAQRSTAATKRASQKKYGF